MSKFGEIINNDTPVVIAFFDDTIHLSSEFYASLRELAAMLGFKGRVIKIDANKNQALVNALRIKYNPTYLIYHKGELLVRLHEYQTEEYILNQIKHLL